MMQFVRRCVASGAAAGLASQLTAALCGRADAGSAVRPIHAISHIAWNDAPGAHRGRHPSNFVLGSALHFGASVFWATFFEALFGERAERSALAAAIGGASVAGAAYVTDYHLVPRRFEPGFEAHVTDRSLLLIYAALAAALAVSARSRGLHHHEIEDRDECRERRDSEHRPDAVVAPE